MQWLVYIHITIYIHIYSKCFGSYYAIIRDINIREYLYIYMCGYTITLESSTYVSPCTQIIVATDMEFVMVLIIIIINNVQECNIDD
jgi:hypothetical protein